MHKDTPFTKEKDIIELYKASLKDRATELPNRNYFEHKKEDIALRMVKGLFDNIKEKNKSNTWAIMFCDIDGLHFVNAKIGQVKADDGIKTIAAIIKDCIRTKRDKSTNDGVFYRSSDKKYYPNVPIRMGGDEFVIILPNCTKEQAVAVANRIKQEINSRLDETKNMTLSIGIADTREITTPIDLNDKNFSKSIFDELISIAEGRMRQDKNKDISMLSDKERDAYVLKHFFRLCEEIGFNVNNPDYVNSFIKSLKDMNPKNIEKFSRKKK
jgi:GGDEF domain-containing protein